MYMNLTSICKAKTKPCFLKYNLNDEVRIFRTVRRCDDEFIIHHSKFVIRNS